MKIDGLNHDFDFLFGEWKVEHRRLHALLVDAEDWDNFAGTMVCRPILGGLGNIDEFFMPTRGAIGSTLRLFDLATGRWSLHWSSSSTGRLEPPVQGGFPGAIGRFYGEGSHRNRAVLVRFIWDHISENSARWRQAFSVDAGSHWETNWIMDLRRTGTLPPSLPGSTQL